MCKLHILNVDFKKVMSIYEMALRVDGPNIEPTLSPYPPRPCPAALVGNLPHSLHQRLLARIRPALQKCLAGSSPHPTGCGTRRAGRSGTSRLSICILTLLYYFLWPGVNGGGSFKGPCRGFMQLAIIGICELPIFGREEI